ncbi:CHAT domain-containing protein [Curtobacterium sp. TC1]|uniref:CHAT domain-containing protein n=1 Tax=Curtobacterium sp. TC1 TaxID=2862880 RepID=UPI001C9A31FE|nr:CHAT domain-containing protein [Curtobacterium sp. TC1]QZQ56208.1 CHAT domain-containing protein [Curtobacterium sp. TC1]
MSRNNDDGAVHAPTPLYIVAAPLGSAGEEFQPLFLEDAPPGGTFDDALRPALRGIWYALHLPKTRFETLDLSLGAIQAGPVGTPHPHTIALIPDTLLQKLDLMRVLASAYDPTLIIADAAAMPAAAAASATIGATLSPITFGATNQVLLDDHWRELTEAWSVDWPERAHVDPTPLTWTWPIPADGSLLPLLRLRRLMGSVDPVAPSWSEPAGSARDLWQQRRHLNALAQLEQELPDDPSDADVALALPAALHLQTPLTRPRLTVSISGTASRYLRFATTTEGVSEVAFRDDYPDVRALLVAHSATSDDSMGILLEDVLDPKVFHALAALEQAWADQAKPSALLRVQQRLDDAAESLWTDNLTTAIRFASSMEVFSNFPIGLLTLPGDSAPLSAMLPINYHTVNPLTRALQSELGPHASHNFASGFTVLIAECIPDSDRVGRASRSAWNLVAQEAKEWPVGVQVHLQETLTKGALRSAIDSVRPNVLVLSAHGFHDAASNVAGVVIGDEHSMGEDLGPMPPLVILSACHTSPRGGGVVNVGDLLLAAGATAVLTTLVPVDVWHNSQLVSRLLRYMSLAVGDEASEPATDVSEVWHRVQTSNVVIDLTYTNPRLLDWSHRRVNGRSPIERFMTGDYGVPLRSSVLYADAEARLLVIAGLQGDVERVRNWLRNPGYRRESLMYTMVGRPSLLRLRAT